MSLTQFLILVIVVIAIAVVVFMFRFKAKKEKKKTSAELHIEALKALLAGNDILAFQRFKEVVTEDTNNVDAYLKLGDLFRKRKNFSKALQIKPEDDNLHIKLGMVQRQRGKIDEAIKHYSEVIRLKPDNLYARINLEVCLRAQGRTEEADYHLDETHRLLQKKEQLPNQGKQ